jgi:N-acetyl-anhydromuramyl-L-alanine amidase AmpD
VANLFQRDRDRPSVVFYDDSSSGGGDGNSFSSRALVEPLKLLRCPFAIHDCLGVMKTMGSYRKGYPEGAVVHFTAGRHGLSALSAGLKSNYCYFLIDRDGAIYQNFDLNRWGSHAGESRHPIDQKNYPLGVSRYFVGIEITSAGRLVRTEDGYQSWFKSIIRSEDVRCVDADYHNIQKGCYEKFTDAQENSLEQLIFWLYRNNPDVFSLDQIWGHDEVCYPKGRKNDPGAALSRSMPEYREYLKKYV